jgi:cytochrome c-type biogenesis protein CcmF
MNAALGTAGVTLGASASIVAVLTLVLGITRRRPQLLRMANVYGALVLLGAVVAFAAMERALITRDYTLAYVADHGANDTPALFNVAALWSALEGSIILWVLVLTGYVVLVLRRFRARLTDPLVSWALVVLFVITAFFFVLMLAPANPFREVAGIPPTDGTGPNPLLQNHPLMLFHPPLLYLGYVGFAVPFAFAVAALVTGRLGEGWLLETRRWTLFSWGFLTVGIILGAWWSYEVLGWGGYWGWDPVENASFLPWLTGTAYLHSVLVQERRGMLRVWNLSLVCATFSLTILGTFLTRSGVVDSVHAFGAGDVGGWLLAFFAVTVLVTIGLIGWRGDRLRSPGSIDSPLSREGFFLANNVLFAAFAFVVLLGTVFPLIVEAVNDDRISVGAPFFDRMSMPIGFALLTLMAIAPVLPWRRTSGEVLAQRLVWPLWIGVGALAVALVVGARGFAPLLAFFLGGFAGGAALRQLVLATRRQGLRGLVGRANGGMVVHLGVILIAVAIAATGSFQRSLTTELEPGETVFFVGVFGQRHTVTYRGIEEWPRCPDEGEPEPERCYPEKSALKALLQVDDGKTYAPAIQTFPEMIIGVPSVRTGVFSDVYLTVEAFDDTDRATGPVTIRILIMPLAVWLWIGGAVMAIGTVLAAFPGRRRQPTDPTSAPVGGSEARMPGPDVSPAGELSGSGVRRVRRRLLGGAHG